MVEPDKKDFTNTTDLEDTVRNLREENAKLLQLIRSQGFLLDTSINPNGKSTDPPESSNITFDHSDLTLTTNSVTTTNQINHQHVNNHGSTNQQNYGGQTVHGNQSNITPNFNTVIQTTSQPFVQNNSNTLVQNNTNLIQPINLVNFNNVSLDSIQSFFASQNSVVYLPQTSSTTNTITTTTTTSSTNLNESISSNILPSISSEHQISIRPKSSLIHQHQELVPVIPKIKTEHYEHITRQLSSSSSNNDTTNLLDNDSNDSKNKHPRPIRPRPSSRANALHVYAPEKSSSTTTTNVLTPSSSYINNNSPTVSLFSSPTCLSPSSSTNYLSQSSSIDHQIDLSPQLIHSKSLDLSTTTDSSLTTNKSNKNRIRNRKKPSTNQTLIPIAPNIGRPLAPAPLNSQRVLTSNNPISKRSTTNKKQTKRNSQTLVQYHSESLLQQNSSPSNSFAESISGLLENFDQELIASNFLTETTTSNLLTDENNSIISSNTNVIRTLDNIDLRHIVNGAIQRHDSYHSTTASMPTLDEFNDRLEHDAVITNQTAHDFNVENEQITSFMSEEDMRLVEMNFDENTFLKQFDLEDAGIKLSVHSDQNLFANILTNNNNNDLIQTQQINNPTQSHPAPPPPPPSLMYPGSSLINNNVFTTVVPLGLQKQSSQTNTFISHTNASTFSPEEGVQLTARHIEPSQVATYESAKYQDILDDLVMVTDQDALRHAQVAAEDDPSVVSTDFSFALLEATNEIMKSTNIQLVGEVPTTFTDLQYFYPIEQEQELLQKQLENCQEQDNLTDQQPIVILEKLQSQIIASTDLTKNVLHTSITDLSSILQYQSTHSPSPHNTSTVELNTPVRLTKTPTHVSSIKSPIDFDSLLPSSKLPNIFDNDPASSYSPISDTLGLSSNSLQQQLRPTTTITTTESPTILSKPSIVFEPISSPSNPSSPLKSVPNEMIIDSGCLDELKIEKTNFINNDDQIEELLRDTTDNQYEIIENQGQTLIKTDVVIDNFDQLIEQIEPSTTNTKSIQLFEETFSRYKQIYQFNLERQQDTLSIKSQEQSLTIPPVKLKLHSIYSQKSSKKKTKRKSSSPSPPEQADDDKPIERPPLRITIRTKLAPPQSEVPSEEKLENKKIRKTKKKKSHHHHHHHHKKKTIADQLETECAGLTRFEQPLAQLYRQQSPPTPDETIPKDEIPTSPPPPPPSQPSTTLHSGFIIDEQTPPSSITSMEHKHSPPPLLINQSKNEQLKINYSHLFNYDSNHEHQNNNTYITPPPEIDLNPQQKTNSYENFCQFSNSPNKKKRYHRKSSVTSSTSSKSFTNTDYAIDTQALEPVSPTPLSTSKQKTTQNQSASNYNDISPLYFEQQRPVKDHYSKKSSSSNRSSRPTSSQIYQQSRTLSNHNHRAPQEPPLLPPILPPPPIHIDPYAQSYHHFAPRAAPSPFFNFPFPHPFLNSHASSAPPHFHHSSMKYHHHPSHGYPTHPQQFPYHPHLQRQQQYNNSNYMSSRDHHSFDR